MGEPQSPAPSQSGQSVNFNGDTYNFPADAKDEEILGFLNTLPGQLSKSHQSEMVHGHAPMPGSPATQSVHGSFLNGDPNVDPDSTFVGRANKRVLDTTVHPLQRVSRAISGTSTAQDAENDKAQSLGLRKSIDPWSEGAPQGLKAAAKVAGASTLVPRSLYGMGKSWMQDPANALGDITVAAGMGGLESAPEEGASTRLGLARPAERTAAAPLSRTSAAASGAESGPSGASATSATPLLTKVPGSRSLLRDVAGLAHGMAAPHSPWGLLDAATSIKSILAKHNAGEPVPAEVNPSTSSPLDAGFTSSTMRSGPAPTVPAGADFGARGTHEFDLSSQPAPKPKLERAPPAWKTSPDTGGTQVESVAPHTQGSLTDTDVSTLLKKAGPARGGKGQVGRAILRKNVKGMRDAGVDPHRNALDNWTQEDEDDALEHEVHRGTIDESEAINRMLKKRIK